MKVIDEGVPEFYYDGRRKVELTPAPTYIAFEPDRAEAVLGADAVNRVCQAYDEVGFVVFQRGQEVDLSDQEVDKLAQAHLLLPVFNDGTLIVLPMIDICGSSARCEQALRYLREQGISGFEKGKFMSAGLLPLALTSGDGAAALRLANRISEATGTNAVPNFGRVMKLG